MADAVINAQIYQGNERLVEWNQPYDLNLEELLKAIGLAKDYLNSYLTDLTTKSKNSGSSNEPVEDDENDEECQEDPLAEMFKKLTDDKTSSKNSDNGVKRKNNSRTVAKRQKK